MLGRRMYKTKLCVLYQRGRCPRQNCSFAHGEAELRRFGGSFNGRRDYRSGDLRDKLDRRHSPPRRYSPGRDGRVYHSFHRQRPVSHEGRSSHSRSPLRRSERRRQKRQSRDGESDISGSPKVSNVAEDSRKEKNITFSDKNGILEKQLRKVQSDFENLDDHKSRLETFLEKKLDEARKLNSSIQDLEIQLNREQEDCKRITSKIEELCRTNGMYMKAHEELKRSQARLQRLRDQLGSDMSKLRTNEEDSSINVTSDIGPNDYIQDAKQNDLMLNVSSSTKKRPLAYLTACEDMKTDAQTLLSEHATLESEAIKFSYERKDSPSAVVDVQKHKRGKVSRNRMSAEKFKRSAVEQTLPFISLSDHIIDELIQDIEIDEKSQNMEAAARNEHEVMVKRESSYIPPLPPPVNNNAYKQYEGDDEDVDVEKVDSEMVDIDLNGEVDVEQ